MTYPHPLMSRRLLLATLTTVVAVAAPATALLGLPIGIPSVDQSIETPAGTAQASAGESGAATCIDLGTPALPVPALPAAPALPALPVPLPVAVPSVPALPALPAPSADAEVCAAAGPGGVSAGIDADAAGIHAGTEAEAPMPVPLDQVESTVGEATQTADSATGGAQGFLDQVVEILFGWM